MNTDTHSSPVEQQVRAHRRGAPAGIYSVCCSHPLVLRAAVKVALEYGTPLLVEATSNQVDQFGGYTGLTPQQFVEQVRALARDCGLPEDRLVLGGDHLGPNRWQNLDAATAMDHADTLIAAYTAAGFHKIHLDCSMRCADDPQYLNDELMAERAARLAAIAEDTATRLGLPKPVYVIGTEVPIPGGESELADAGAVTNPAAAARTLDVHRRAFAAAGLRDAWQRVIAMVVQPGVDFDHSRIQHYDREAARELSAFIAGQPGLVFEAHSTDYQRETALHALVRDHFAILKVGPALTFALREALLALCQIEAELIEAPQASGLMAALDEAMLAHPEHWIKHYHGDERHVRVLRRYGLSDRCRYYWGEPAVAAAVDKLFANLDRVTIPLPLLSQHLPEQHADVIDGTLEPAAEELVLHKIGRVLSQYARACHRNMAAARDGKPTTIC